MKHLFTFVALLALCAVPALAQELTTGTIEGIVSAEDGAPLADAIVTVMGPQGVRTTVTDSQGRFAVRGLTPGDYQIKAEASGYSTVVQSEVKIFIARRTQLPFTLTKGLTEQVTVTSEAPIVDMKSTSTGASIKIDDFAPYIPLGRNLTSVYTIAPGVADGGDPVLGSTNSSISGSSGLENAYFVDGVNITNAGYGAIGAYSIVYGSLGSGVTYDFLEEVQVKTGGFEAEYGQAGGGVVNSVVRSGSNEFSVDAGWYETVGSLEGTRGQRLDSPNWGNIEESQRRDLSVSVGGPFIKDKLFFFAAYNPIEIEDDFTLTSGNGTVDYYVNDTNSDGMVDGTDTPSQFGVGQTITGDTVPSSVTRKRSIDNYAGKVSWFATPNHKIELTAFGDPSDGEVGAQSPTSFLRVLADPINNLDPTASATGLDWGGDQYSFKYQGVWTSNFFTEIQVANKKNDFSEIGPGTTFRSILVASTNNTIGGAGFFEGTEDEVDQYSFKNTHVFGPVELTYGGSYEDIAWAQPRRYSGPAYTEFFPNLIEQDLDMDPMTDPTVTFAPGCTSGTNLSDPACYTQVTTSTGAAITDNEDGTFNVDRTEFIPASESTTAEETNFFAQVTWSVIPQVTIKAGLRWTEQELTGAGAFTLPIGALPVSGVSAGGMTTALNAQTYKFDSEIAPRLGVTWDVRNNGKHKLFANYGQYYQRVPSDLAVRAFSNEVGTSESLFNDAGLSMPNLGSSCLLFNGTTSTACHRVTQVQGLAGGGSIILDGTQLDPMSDAFAALGDNVGLVTGDATVLPYTEEMLFGYAWEMNDHTGVEVRWIHRELGEVLEDVQFASNEQTFNLFFGDAGGNSAIGDPFPGHGSGAFGAYVFANVGSNVDSNLFPTPVRDYDALELVYNRRFNNGWMAYANYRFARLNGNYEGSFRNDNGQSDPFLTSLFDFPAASAVDSNSDGTFDTFITSQTLIGQYTNGPLNTERTHIFNGFVSKQFDFGLNLGGRINIQDGRPRAPLFAHPAYQNSGEVPGFNPVFWWGVDLDTDPLADATEAGSGCTPFDAMNPMDPYDPWCEDGIVDNDPVALGFFQDPDGTGDASALIGTMYDSDGDGMDDGLVLDHFIDTDGDGVVDAGEFGGGFGDGFATGPRLFSYDVVQRDFFGRTPTIVTFDIKAAYDLNLSGGSKLTFMVDIFNLFNDNNSSRFDDDAETRPGVRNVDFLKANGFQTPRQFRLGLKYTF